MKESKVKPLLGNHKLPADLEFLFNALFLASYSDQPQRLIAEPEAFPDTWIQYCHKLGVGLAPQHDGMELRGGGWTFSPTSFDLPDLGSIVLDLLQVSYLRFHKQELKLTREAQTYRKELKSYLNALGLQVEEEENALIVSRGDLERLPKIPKEFPGQQFWLRNDRLWQCIPSMTEARYKELFSLKEHLLSLAHTWGFEIEKDIPNLQELDELERRLLKLKGGLQDKRATIEVHPPTQFRKRSIPLGGDSQLAATFVTLALLTPGSNLVLEDVLISSHATQFFQIVRKMGATCEVVSKRESLGESLGKIKVQYCQELGGKKIAGEALYSCLESFPLLALLASFAEGETVIRGFSLLPHSYHETLHNLMVNLKRAGVDIGEFEDGIVIRGRAELDGAEFDAEGHPALTRAYWILTQTTKGHSNMLNPHPETQSNLEKVKADILSLNHE